MGEEGRGEREEGRGKRDGMDGWIAGPRMYFTVFWLLCSTC